MSRNLPQFPNLDYLKKRAKSLLRELQCRSRGAKLTQAQHAIAREYGFPSWTKLKVYVESVLHPCRLTIFCARYFALRDKKPIWAEHLLLGIVQADGGLMNRLLPGQFQARPAPELDEMAQLKVSLAKRIPMDLV